MNQPELEANLSTVTDDEWLEAHARLVEKYGHIFPDGELDFVWDPALDPKDLIAPDEVDAFEQEEDDA